MESATGLGGIGTVKLLERPHATANYLTNEMAFRIARKHSEKLRRIALLLGFALPVVLLALSLSFDETIARSLQIGATFSLMMGLFTERWLFFATAKHAVGLYYGGDEALVPQD